MIFSSKCAKINTFAATPFRKSPICPEMNSPTPILITGAAGFIGFHLTYRLLKEGNKVVGLDNLNHYYDVSLKQSRLQILKKRTRFTFVKGDLADKKTID